MQIAVNLATHSFVDLRPAMKRLRIAMGALALIAIALGSALHASHQEAKAARARDLTLGGQIARINQERQGYERLMQQTENAQLLDRVGDLNQLFDEKSFSWTLAMEDLETVLPSGVQVSTLEPIRAKDGSITLHLRVVGPRDKAVELLRNLEHSKHFHLPRIIGENSENSGGPGQKLVPISASNSVNFDLLADYDPAAAMEPRTGEDKQGKEWEEKAEAAATPAAEIQVHTPGRQFGPQAAKAPAPGSIQSSARSAFVVAAPAQRRQGLLPATPIAPASKAVAPAPAQTANLNARAASNLKPGGPQ